MKTDFSIEGFSEAGIATRQADHWLEVFCGLGQYIESWRGPMDDATKALWGIPAETRIHEHLLCPPQAESGHVRLFEFDKSAPHNQLTIRESVECQDSGGIFDLDIRVPDVPAYYRWLESRGWHAISQPIDWPFGELHVREGLIRGPDAVVLALIQRLAPPLPEFDALKAFSHIFNSSQTVADMSRAISWYEKLGFKTLLHHHGPLKGRGGEVLGLSPEQAPVTNVELVIMQPQGQMQGSVELVRIEGVESRDVALYAQPWNLGLNVLRFPVSSIESFQRHLEETGINLAGGGLVESVLEPFGAAKILALQSPDGAWLEFYELI